MPEPAGNPPPTPRRKWLRRLAIGASGFVLLLFIGYLAVTSGAFFKGVILPRVGRTLNAEITVADASIHPFSGVTLQGLTVKPAGGRPVLQADRIQVRYDLWSILRGRLRVDEVMVAAPVLDIVQNADGTSNLDPLLQGQPSPPGAAKPGAASPGQPLQLAVKAVSIKDATVRLTRDSKEGGRQTVEISRANLSLDQLANGQSGKLVLDAESKVDQVRGQEKASLQGRSGGSIEFALGPDLMPRSVTGRVTHDIVSAGGMMADLAGLRATFDCDVTPGEIKQMALRFSRTNQPLGEVKITGPLDLAKREGRLKLDLGPLDRQVLNLAGALAAVDFGPTRVGSTLEIEIGKGGSALAAKGQLQADQFSLRQQGKTTTAMDLRVGFSGSADLTGKVARWETLSLSASQGQQPLLSGGLARPVTINWGGPRLTWGDSAFDLAVTNFNLADWRSFVGDAIAGGRLNLRLKLQADREGHLLKTDLDGDLQQLVAQAGSNRLDRVDVRFQLASQCEDFDKVNLERYSLALARTNATVLTITGSGRYVVSSSDLTLQSKIDAALSGLSSLVGRPDLGVSAGTLQLSASYSQQHGQTNASGFVQVSDLSGHCGGYSFQNLASRLDYDVELKPALLTLRQVMLRVSPTDRAKNELRLSGRLDLRATNVYSGAMSLRAESLDLTPYYDLVAGKPVAAAPPPEPTPQGPTPGPAKEPEAMTFPLRDFTIDAKIDRVFLRELAVSNWLANARVNGGRVQLATNQLTLNGAPVSLTADLDLGVTGWAYDVTFRSDKVPLEPLANTFSPDTKGQYQGLLLADARIKGTGFEGTNLQKHLDGYVRMSFTNANLQLLGPRTKRVVVPIAALLRVNELTQSPLNWLQFSAALGGGRIDLQDFSAQSEAFEAAARGVVPIAGVFTNSPLNLPVDFALRRSLAQKSGLMPADTPQEARYVKLPPFLTLKGTVGAPKSELNEMVITGLLLKSGVGLAGRAGVNVGGPTGDVLKGLGNLLTGGSSGGAVTNQGAKTNTPANPLDLFRKKPAK